MHTFNQRPLALAIALALSSPAWADSISMNSTTLDGTSGTVLGNTSRQSPMASFHQAQKEMVFATLRHLGIQPENLPARVRSELERPQTTSPQAFIAFAMALDKADKGQYAQASNLLKQAAQLDPQFNLAKGMLRVMPKVDVPPGASSQVIEQIKREAREEAQRTSNQLNQNQNQTQTNLNRRSESRGGQSATQRRLNALAAGEGQGENQNSNTGAQFENLGMSDQGDSTLFDSGSGETLANGGSGTENGGGTETGGGATNLAQGDTSGTSGGTSGTSGTSGSTSGTDGGSGGGGTTGGGTTGGGTTGGNTGGTTTTVINNANQDQQRDLVVNSTVDGFYAGYINGQFVTGEASLDLNQANASTDPAHKYTLKRTGQTDTVLSYEVDNDIGALTLDSLWGVDKSFLGVSEQDGLKVYHSSLSASGQLLYTVAGARTPEANVISTGRESFNMAGFLTNPETEEGFSLVNGAGLVDWRVGKVLALKTMSNSNQRPLLLGELNRQDARFEVGVRQRVDPMSGAPFSYVDSGVIELDLYGAEAPDLAAGLLDMQPRDAQGQAVGNAMRGLVIADSFTPYTTSSRAPASGEAWVGRASGLTWSDGSITAQGGTSQFTFSPDSATVTGGISVNGQGFTTTSADPNAYFSIHAFAAQKDRDGVSYYSTQGDFGGTGWTSTRYSAMGYWEHDYQSNGQTVAFIAPSTWVAGLATTSTQLPQSGWVDYSGKVLGGIVEGSSHMPDLVTGKFQARVDFGLRKTRGSIEDLIRQSDSQVWLSKAEFTTTYNSVTPYQASLQGNGVDSAQSSLIGQFYGPGAEETGGSWIITKSTDSWASGVYTAARGNIDTSTPSGLEERKPNLDGLYAAFLGNQFVSGDAQLDPNQADASPARHSITLDRSGAADLVLNFNVGSDGVNGVLPATSSLWGYTGSFSGSSNMPASQDAYLAEVVRSGQPVLYAVGGERTESTALPSTGVQSMTVKALVYDSDDGIGSMAGRGFVDWGNSKVFIPLSQNQGNPMFLGTVDRTDATLTLTGQDLETPGDTAAYGVSSGLDLKLFGDTPKVAGDTFTYTMKDSSQTAVGTPAQGIMIAQGFTNQTAPTYFPTATQTWQGQAVGVLYDASGDQVSMEAGTANFTLSPGNARVTGQIEVNGEGFSTTSTDVNTYINPLLFGARDQGSNGQPSYFSTQGDFTGAGWTDLRYTTVGYWAHNYEDDGAYGFLNKSTWVAGLLTSAGNMPTQGWATYGGKVLGVEHSEGPSGHRYELVTGDFHMNADFGRRTVTGALTGLDTNDSSSFLPNQVEFHGSFSDANTYTARINGFDAQGEALDGAYSSLQGMFYGPQAQETGGPWRFGNDTGQAAGVFTGARGSVKTPATALWAGSVDGSFMVDLATVSRVANSGDQPDDVLLKLYRAGSTDSEVRYQANGENDFSYLSHAISGHNSGYANGGATVYDDAYLMSFGYTPTNGGNTAITALAFGGNRTTEAQLPVGKQYGYSMVVLNHRLSTGESEMNYDRQLAVDFTTRKAFSPIRIQPEGSDGALLLGELDNATGRIDMQGVQRLNEGQGWIRSSDMYADLYGSEGKILGGLFGMEHDQMGDGSFTPVGQGVMAGHSNGYAGYHSLRTVADGETWHGYSSNLALDKEAGVYASGKGIAQFQFQTAQGRVIGEISNDEVIDHTYSNNEEDPSAFMGTNGFGGAKLTEDDEAIPPFYYSTRSTHTSWENIPGSSLYAYLDKLSYHYVGNWSAQDGENTIEASSNWVAGLASGVNTPTAGYIRYAGYASGLALNDDGSRYDFVSGLFGMTADFGARTVSGRIGNLTQHSGDFNLGVRGLAFTGYFSGDDGYVSDGVEGVGANLNGGMVEGMFYGDSANPASETGGRWSLRTLNGNSAFGIYSGMDRNILDFSSGVLAGLGDQGTLAAAHPLAAYLEHWSDNEVHGEFVLPGMLGQFTSADAQAPTSILGGAFKEAGLFHTDTGFDLEGPNLGEVRPDFRTVNSYVQYANDRSFYRWVLNGTQGEYVEGFHGHRATSIPNSGVSSYVFNLSSVREGQNYHGVNTGASGVAGGRLYVNWATGQAIGFNLDHGVTGGGIALVAGRVTDHNRIEGSLVLRTSRLMEADAADSPRFITDAGGLSLDLYGKGTGTPVGVGGVLNTNWQGEDLAEAAGSGQSLISGLRDRSVITTAYQPAQDEKWNGFAVAFVSHRGTGNINLLSNSSASEVQIKFRPTTGDGHVWADISTGFDLVSNSATASPASISIHSDNNAPDASQQIAGTSTGDMSVYVSTKAFAAIQQSASNTGLNDTPDMVAAMPEAITTTAEAERYSYTTWGYWSGDLGGDKSKTVAPSSMWVAGKLTNTTDMPASGTATYTGVATGLAVGLPGGASAGVSGQLNMNVNYAARTVGGSINNLNLNGNSTTPWVAQANLNGSWNSGSVQYAATLSGTSVTTGSAVGAFFGPQAAETGGRWSIVKSDGSRGTGIFMGKK